MFDDPAAMFALYTMFRFRISKSFSYFFFYVYVFIISLLSIRFL